jgi:uncharacterized membrane protein YidH (DUF202 family)
MDDVGAAIGGIVLLSVLLALFGFWVWSLVDAVRVPDDSSYRVGSMLAWVLVIVFTGLVGAVVYWAAGRPKAA